MKEKTKVLVLLLVVLTALMFYLSEKMNVYTTSEKVAVVNKEETITPLVPYKTDSILGEKDMPFLPETTESNVVISNSEIQEMLDLVVKINGISNPNLIYKGQLILFQFPDNKHFQFYELVEQDQNLWNIVKNLLIVTSKK